MEDHGGSEVIQRGGWVFRFNRGQEGDKFKFDELLESGKKQQQSLIEQHIKH